MQDNVLNVGPEPLDRDEVVDVARGGMRVKLTQLAEDGIAATRQHIETLAADQRPTYGVSTGLGALAVRHIPSDRRAARQRSFVRSHAAGAGPAVEPDVGRAQMLLRLHTIASGRTGVRRKTAHALAGMLNAGVVPVVHEFGSLGCSG